MIIIIILAVIMALSIVGMMYRKARITQVNALNSKINKQLQTLQDRIDRRKEEVEKNIKEGVTKLTGDASVVKDVKDELNKTVKELSKDLRCAYKKVIEGCDIGYTEGEGNDAGCCVLPSKLVNPTNMKIKLATTIIKDVAIGYAAGEMLERSVKKAVEKKAATEATEQVGKKTAKEVGEKVGKEAAEEAAEKFFKLWAKKTGEKVATKTAATAGKGGMKGAIKGLSKMAAKTIAAIKAKIMARVAARAAAKSAEMGAKTAAKAGMGPVGWASLAFDVLSMALDVFDPAGYSSFTSNSINTNLRNVTEKAQEAAALKEEYDYPTLINYKQIWPDTANIEGTIHLEFTKEIFEMFEKEMPEVYEKFKEMDEYIIDEEADTIEENPTYLKAFERIMTKYLPQFNEKYWKEKDQRLFTKIEKAIPHEQKKYLKYYEGFATKTRTGVGLTEEGVKWWNDSKREEWYKYNDFDGNAEKPKEEDYAPPYVALYTDKYRVLDKDNPGTDDSPNMKVMKLPEKVSLGIPLGMVVSFCEEIRRPSSMAGTKTAAINPRRYGNKFDIYTGTCRYSAKYCSRMGLETVENKEGETDCRPYKGQEIAELILGTTITRGLIETASHLDGFVNGTFDKLGIPLPMKFKIGDILFGPTISGPLAIYSFVSDPKGFTYSLGDQAKKTWNKYNDVIKDKLNIDMSHAATVTGDAIKDSAYIMGDSVKDAANKVADVAEDSAAFVKDVNDKIAKYGKEGVVEVGKQFESGAKQIGRGVEDAAKKAADKIRDQERVARRKIRNAKRDAERKAKKAGNTIIGGITNTAKKIWRNTIGKLSDKRLKNNINMIVQGEDGMNLYEWEWNGIAKELYGLEGKTVGLIAFEIYEKYPEAIKYDENHYKMIDKEICPYDEIVEKLKKKIE